MRISDWSSDVCSSDLHGEMRHMVEHARLALAQGVPETVVPKNGSAIRLAPGAPKVISHEKVGRLVLDGDVILPDDGAPINARRRISVHGYLAVTVVLGRNRKLAGTPLVTARGIPAEGTQEAFPK